MAWPPTAYDHWKTTAFNLTKLYSVDTNFAFSKYTPLMFELLHCLCNTFDNCHVK